MSARGVTTRLRPASAAVPARPVPVDLLEALDGAGVVVTDVRDCEAWARCPEPSHEDNSPSWSVNLANGRSHCFGCGFGGGLEHLRRELALPPVRLAPGSETERRPDSAAPAMGDFRLAAFSAPPSSALRRRHLSCEAAAQYEVRWEAVDRAWVLPLRAPTGELLGWQLKASRGEGCLNYPPGIPKSSTLFGLRAATNSSRHLVVVESPLDAVRLASAGIAGGVATMGGSLSRPQLTLLQRHADRVTLALDADDAGRRGALAVLQALRGPVVVALTGFGDTAKDPGDVADDEDLRALFRTPLPRVAAISVLREVTRDRPRA